MKKPLDFKKYTDSEKRLFVIAEYLGWNIIETPPPIDYPNNAARWNVILNHNFNVSNCPIEMWGTKDETYSKLVKELINDKYGRAGKYLTDWSSLIYIIELLRKEDNHTQAFKNQLKQIDHYLLYLQIETTAKYVVGAINVLSGKKGEYPI